MDNEYLNFNMVEYIRNYIYEDMHIDTICGLVSSKLLADLVGFEMDENYIKTVSERINSVNNDTYNKYFKNKKRKFEGKWEFLAI
jgi:hypothetical protein